MVSEGYLEAMVGETAVLDANTGEGRVVVRVDVAGWEVVSVGLDANTVVARAAA